MKAVFLSNQISIGSSLDAFNKELKDAHCILEKISCDYGTILIIDNVTRKDKLEKINKISNEKGTTDNSI